MAILFPEPKSIDWNGRPQQMSKEDYEIWKKVKDNELRGAVAVYYDVPLGGDNESITEVDEGAAKSWVYSTSKRIDVVVEFPDYWNLIELRHNASSSAIGRLLQYKLLWEKERIDNLPIKLTLISDNYDKSVHLLCNEYGIIYKV
ncbi:MAG: hypothetical protein ACUVQ9_12915 [Thermodesulfobacteriota bacterium]